MYSFAIFTSSGRTFLRTRSNNSFKPTLLRKAA
ncbi:hypothetical protein [Pseudorhodoferax sp.]